MKFDVNSMFSKILLVKPELTYEVFLISFALNKRLKTIAYALRTSHLIHQ